MQDWETSARMVCSLTGISFKLGKFLKFKVLFSTVLRPGYSVNGFYRNLKKPWKSLLPEDWKSPFGVLSQFMGLLVAFETTLFPMLSLNGRGTWHQQQHQIIKSKGYENYWTDYQRNNALILNQILSTILKRNTWRSVLRICMWIMGLKGLNNSTYLVYSISDWRTAFELSGTIRDILS